MTVIANIDIHITYISSYLEEPESKNTETHVSYLWRFNLILSYLFLRSSVGFRLCISHIWLLCGTPCCKMKDNPSRSAACWHNQHLCFLALTCITLLTCMAQSVKDPMVSFASEALLLDSILIPPIFCWQLTQYSWGQEAAAVAKQKTKENPPGIGHC